MIPVWLGLLYLAIGVAIGWSLHKGKLTLDRGDKVYCRKCGAWVLTYSRRKAAAK